MSLGIASRIKSHKRLRQAAFVRGHLERLDQLSKGTHPLWQMRWAERRVEEGRLRMAALRNIRTLFKGFGEPRELARLARRFWRDADLDMKTNPSAVAALRSIMLQRTKDLRVQLAADTAEVLRETSKMAQESTRLVLVQQKEQRELRLVQPVAKQRRLIDTLGPRMHDELTVELVESVSTSLEGAFEGYAGDLANTIVEASNPSRPLTMSKLAGELENDFLDISRKRAMLIARTESARVYGAVSLNEMKQLGIEERRWLTAAGSPAAAISPVCEFCIAMANEGWVSVNEQIQASLMVGIRNPQQKEIEGYHPPFHPNCRCDIQANVDDWFPGGDLVEDGPLEFGSVEEANDWAQQNLVTPSLESYSNSQYEALRYYKDRGYGAVNSYLRGSTYPTARSMPEVVAHMDSAVARYIVPEDVLTFRGAVLDNSQFQVGAQITDPAFVSTSFSREVADSFGGTILEIIVPRGTNGVFYGAGEAELLLGRGTTFVVESVTYNEATFETVVRLRVI